MVKQIIVISGVPSIKERLKQGLYLACGLITGCCVSEERLVSTWRSGCMIYTSSFHQPGEILSQLVQRKQSAFHFYGSVDLEDFKLSDQVCKYKVRADICLWVCFALQVPKLGQVRWGWLLLHPWFSFQLWSHQLLLPLVFRIGCLFGLSDF